MTLPVPLVLVYLPADLVIHLNVAVSLLVGVLAILEDIPVFSV